MLQFQVAIKYIKKNKVQDDTDLCRLRREIRIMSSLCHPNIINIREGMRISLFIFRSAVWTHMFNIDSCVSPVVYECMTNMIRITNLFLLCF